MAAIAGSAATILEAVREHRPGDARVRRRPPGRSSATRPRARSARTRPAARRRPMRSPSSPRTSWSGAMRAHDGLHASSGIVYNHESERRPEQFVTRRITRGAAAIALGLQQELTLGALDAVRDWSFAGDIMRGAWLMLQQERPEDYVLASGVPRTVAELARDGVRVRRPRRRALHARRPRARARRPSGRRASATRAGRASGWAGSRGCPSRSWSSAWCEADLRSLQSLRPAAERARPGPGPPDPAPGRPTRPQSASRRRACRRQALHWRPDGHRWRHRTRLRRPAAGGGVRAGGLRRDRGRRRLAQDRGDRRPGESYIEDVSIGRCCARSPGASTRRRATRSWPRPTPC